MRGQTLALAASLKWRDHLTDENADPSAFGGVDRRKPSALDSDPHGGVDAYVIGLASGEAMDAAFRMRPQSNAVAPD